MSTTSLADAKNRLSQLVAEIERTHERTIITKNGRPVAALVAVEDLEGLEETLEILSHPEDAAALRQAIAEGGSGETVTGEEMGALLAERRRLGGRGLTDAEVDAVVEDLRHPRPER